jgi:hypothetical protein
MADKEIVRIGDNGPEEVAYKLLDRIIRVTSEKALTKAAMLDLYAECLEATSGLRRSAADKSSFDR